MSTDSTRDVVLRARGLDAGYRGKTVLTGVDLEIHAGDFWFLLGKNGSGKTTLLRALLGLRRPLAGTLVCAALDDREHLGFVPQRCELNPSLPTTVREFVGFGLVATRVPAADRAERLRWALARAGLEGMERRSYWSLSGGQRQRALVARALVRRPSLLVLDEPTEGLDPVTEDAILGTLAQLNERSGTTVLFVSHKLVTAARYASHVALFGDGRVHGGPRDAVLVPEQIERVYGAPIGLDGAVGRPVERELAG